MQKIAATFLIFSCSFVGISPTGAAFYSVPSSHFETSNAGAEKITPENLSRLKPPQNLGAIEEIHEGRGGRTVILIQDAHGIPDAQKSLFRLVEYFVQNYGVNQIALEGTSAQLDTTFLRSFPDRKKLEEVLRAYLDRGEISGAAAAAFLSGRPARYFGVESQDLYEQGVDWFLQALAGEPRLIQKLKPLRQAINREKKAAYPVPLWELDQTWNGWQENKIKSQELTAVLRKFGQGRQGPALTAKIYPHLFSFFEQIKQEHQTNPVLRGRLLRLGDEMRKRLDQKDREGLGILNRALQEYRLERLSSVVFAQNCLDLARKYQWADLEIQIRQLPALQKILSLNLSTETLRGDILRKEITAYCKQIKRYFLNTKALKALNQKDEVLCLLEKLIRLGLTREEWREWKIRRRGDGLPLDLEEFEPNQNFYHNAEAREKAMLRNLLLLLRAPEGRSNLAFKNGIASSASPPRNDKVALFVSGGFHTQGFRRALRKKGISYVLITPAINEIPESIRYRDFMRGQVSWRDYFEVKNGRIDLYESFTRATRDRLLKDSHLLKPWRDNLIERLARERRLEKAGEYTRFLDEIAFNAIDPDTLARTKTRWLGEVRQFFQGVKVLNEKNQLTPENVLTLSHQFTMPAWNFTPAGTVPYPWKIGAARENDQIRIRDFVPIAENTGARSELRWQKEEDLLFGIHERNPDWWIMRLIGAAMLEIKSRKKSAPIGLIEITEKVKARMIAHGFKNVKDQDKQLWTHIQKLLGRMKGMQLISKENNQYDLAGSEYPFAIKVHAIHYIADELRRVLEKYEKANDYNKADESERLAGVLKEYALASETWPKYPVEARWPFLKAVTLLNREHQQLLLNYLEENGFKEPLLDSVRLMLSKKAPKDWLRQHTPHLVGSAIFYVSPETWLAAGGLGRVGQYHTSRIKELVGDDASMVTMEPYYSTYDSNAPEGEKMKPIDYSKVTVPVENLEKVMDFTIRVGKRVKQDNGEYRSQRVNVTVDGYRGKNQYGIEVYLIKDRPAEGKPHGYFVNELYKYEDMRKPLPYESATWEEFSEFLSKASLKLIKRVKKQMQDVQQKKEIPTIIWANDGQAALIPIYKRISDQWERLSLEQKERVRNNPNLAWKDVFLGRDDIPLSEFADLFQDENEASLLKADTNQTTHTYRNRGFFHNFFPYLLHSMPEFWRKYFKSVVDENTWDITRAGIAAAEAANAVSAIQAQEMNSHNPETVLIGISNGDDRDVSRAAWVKILKQLDPQIDPDNLTPQQIVDGKREAKKLASVDDDFLKLDPEFTNLRADRPVFSTSVRAVEEKLDNQKVFNEYNIQRIVNRGGQIILFANIQADPEGKSRQLFDELKAIQRRVNTSEEAKETGGRLIVATGWGPLEQRKIFAMTDAAIFVSARDPRWGTEAAGVTEADYALNGALIITSTYLEGLFQQQGDMIDWTRPGIGNTIIPEGDDTKHYREAMELVVNPWNNNPLDFAAYQSTSVKLSRILDARLTAAEYLRHFEALRVRRENPLAVLESYVRGERRGIFLKNEWFRADLISQLSEMAERGEIDEFEHSGSSNIRSFVVPIDKVPHIVSLKTGLREEGESTRTILLNGDNNVLHNVLQRQDTPTAKVQIQVVEAVTETPFQEYPAEQLLKGGLPIDIPEGFQVLTLSRAADTSRMKATRKNLFENTADSSAIRNALLELIPEALWKHLEAEGYGTKEDVIWYIPPHPMKEEGNTSHELLYARVDKGNNGQIVLTLAPSMEEISDLETRLKSVFDKKAFAHINLRAYNETLIIGGGKINMPLDEPASHGVFKKWFTEYLEPWAKEFGFKKIRIQRTQLTPEVLKGLHFNLADKEEEIWEYQILGGGSLVKAEMITDPAAKRLLDTSSEGFVWKSSHEHLLLPEVQRGLLGWLDDYLKIEEAGEWNAALRFHTGLHSVREGDILKHADGLFAPIRGLAEFKSRLKQIRASAISATAEDMKIEKSQEAVNILKGFAKRLAWKVFRDYAANKEYARQAFQNPQKGKLLRKFLIQHLQDLTQDQPIEKLSESPEWVSYAIPLDMIHPLGKGFHGKKTIVSIPLNGQSSTVIISAEQMKSILASESAREPRGILQAVHLIERLRLGTTAGRLEKLDSVSDLESNGYSISIRTTEPSVIFFESGESQQLINYLRAAFQPEGNAYVRRIQEEIQRYLGNGRLKEILSEIAAMNRDAAETAFGAENLIKVMAFISSLDPEISERHMKDWDPKTHEELSKTFSRKRDYDVYTKGEITFHEVSRAAGLIFSKTYNGQQIFFPFLLGQVQAEDLDKEGKVAFDLTDVVNIKMETVLSYYVRNKVTGTLYVRRPHTLESLMLDPQTQRPGWTLRVPGDARYQILEFEKAETKAPGVRHKFEMMQSVNVIDIGMEREGGRLVSRSGVKKLRQKLAFIAKTGNKALYGSGFFMTSADIRDPTSLNSGEVHTVPTAGRHFLPLPGGGTSSVVNYSVKSFTYVAEDGQTVTVPDNQGNVFSPIRDKNGVPLLNPRVFEPSDKATEEERQADYRKQFKGFNEYAKGLGIEMFYDHVFWYVPENVNSDNYTEFFYREVSEAEGRRYGFIESDRIAWRDGTEAEALAGKYDIRPEKFAAFAEEQSQLYFGRRKDYFMAGIVANNPEFFAIRVVDKKSGKERVVLIKHLESNIDQALPNPASPRIRQEQLNYINFLKEHGAAGVRSDLAGKLLSYGNAGWLGNHYEIPGLLYSIPFDKEDEFWKWLITESKGFKFIMEAYGPEERDHLARAGAYRLYFKELVEAFQTLAKGGAPGPYLNLLKHVFLNHDHEGPPLIAFISNDDERRLSAVGQEKYGVLTMGLMAAAGIPTMIAFADLTDVGSLYTNPGGKDAGTGEIIHTTATEEQAPRRDTWENYDKAIDTAPGFRWLGEFQKAIEVPGQRYFEKLLNQDHSASGIAVQEPETGKWTLAVGHHRLGPEETREVWFPLPDVFFSDGRQTFNDGDFEVYDVETGEVFPIENHHLKINFGPGKEKAARLLRWQNARSELRRLFLPAHTVIQALASRNFGRGEARALVKAVKRFGFEKVAQAAQGEAASPSVLLAHLKREKMLGVDSPDLWTAFESSDKAGQFFRAHTDYPDAIEHAVGRRIEGSGRLAGDYLIAHPSAKLNYAFALSLERAEGKTLDQMQIHLQNYLQKIRAIKELGAKYPRVKIQGNIRILINPSQAGDPALEKFRKAVGRSGVAKLMVTDDPRAAGELELFLKQNPNALVYGLEGSVLTIQDPGLHERIVESPLPVNSQLPVTLILTDHLAQGVSHLTPDEIQRIQDHHGSVIWNGRRYEITTDALQLVYQDYRNEAYTSTMA